MTDRTGATESTAEDDGTSNGLLAVCAVGVVAGIIVGFIGGAFRWCLRRAGDVRLDVVDWARDLPGPGWLVVAALVASCAASARLIVRWVPLAAGSGIQHVEAVWRGESALAGLIVLPAKFVGGLLALGSGLVLGREGPTVQMGAVIGTESGRRVGISGPDLRLLQAALAGAGLAVAFNAPLGGAIFVFEEVTKTFRLRLVLVTLISCAVAVSCSRVLVGNAPDLPVGSLPTPSIGWVAAFVVFGLVTGALGAAYNRLIAGALRAADWFGRRSAVGAAGLIGAVIGILLYVDPLAAGEGDTVTQRVLDSDVLLLSSIGGYLLVRFVAGPLSYAAGTPGGLFSPLLAVGALWGALVHGVIGDLVPALDIPVQTWAIVGMAAFFAAVVRAPLTGIALMIEMTGAAELTTVLLASSFAATLAAGRLRSAPIYDTLRARLLDGTRRGP